VVGDVGLQVFLAGAACRRKIEMSPGVQSRDDIPVGKAEEREFACIPQWS
jgi:hypothetical protein